MSRLDTEMHDMFDRQMVRLLDDGHSIESAATVIFKELLNLYPSIPGVPESEFFVKSIDIVLSDSDIDYKVINDKGLTNFIKCWKDNDIADVSIEEMLMKNIGKDIRKRIKEIA
jgi:hypothetical protein